MIDRQTTQPADCAGQAAELLIVSKTDQSADRLAKLPYRAPRIAIPARAVARAMQAGFDAAEQLPDFVAGVPIVGQAVGVEEAYWADVWRRLSRPDPGLYSAAPTSEGA